MRLPAPVPSLPGELVRGGRLLPGRDALLELLPREATVVEVGVALGGFSRPLIDFCRPAQFIAIDSFRLHELPSLWGRPPPEHFGGKTHLAWYRDLFAADIDAGRMQALEGDSGEQMEWLPDASVDVFYIDADHAYAPVRRDLAVAVRKIKPDGWMIVNDYVLIDQLGAEQAYGVIYATHEFMLEHHWAIQYLTLQPNMFCDVVLRRPEFIDARLATMEVENAHLRREVRALRSEIAALQNSGSWRMSYPIRAVGRLLGRD